MAYICYKPKGSCKTCVHHRFDEDKQRMCCWEEYDVDQAEHYEYALEQLEELDLDTTEYEYYYRAITDMYHDDKLSYAYGPVGYPSYESIIKSARKTARRK